jgi:hypothetical protein
MIWGMNTALKKLQGTEAVEPAHGLSDEEIQRQTRARLGRLARDCESLREMRAILDRIYGRTSRAR